MNFLNKVGFFLIIFSFISCENEVDVNSDFEEVTLVYGLLDKNSDTQFVKINRTFLDDQLSAIDLAKQSERINYDSLTVHMIDEITDSSYALQKIIKPKDPGVFNREDNVLYYTTQTLLPNRSYRLTVVKPDGSETIGRTSTIDTIRILNPKLFLAGNSSVSFTNFLGNSVANYKFEFSTGNNVGEFEVRMNFLYVDETPDGDIPKKVSMNIGRIFNPTLERGQVLPFIFNGELFFNALEEQIPASANPTKKVFNTRNNIEIEIYAADGDYSFYRELNGPIEGLAQTRPEFTNMENGIGLFASRFSMVAKTQISNQTRNYLIQTYRDTRNFSAE